MKHPFPNALHVKRVILGELEHKSTDLGAEFIVVGLGLPVTYWIQIPSLICCKTFSTSGP